MHVHHACMEGVATVDVHRALEIAAAGDMHHAPHACMLNVAAGEVHHACIKSVAAGDVHHACVCACECSC